MLAAMIRFRPNRSINQPPSNPNTPPQSAVIHNIFPVHCVTNGLLAGTWRNSAMAGTATRGVISSS